MSKCDRILHHLLWFRTGLKRIQKCRRFPTMSNFGVAMAILCNFEIYEICSNEFNVYQDVDIWGWDSADMKKTGAIWSQERSSQTMVVVADWDGTSWSQNTTLPCFGRLRSASVGMCEDVDDFYLWEHDLHRFQEDCMYDHMYIYMYIYMPFAWKSTPDLNDNDCPHLYPRSSMIQTIDIFRYSLLDLNYGNIYILTP